MTSLSSPPVPLALAFVVKAYFDDGRAALYGPFPTEHDLQAWLAAPGALPENVEETEPLVLNLVGVETTAEARAATERALRRLLDALEEQMLEDDDEPTEGTPQAWRLRKALSRARRPA